MGWRRRTAADGRVALADAPQAPAPGPELVLTPAVDRRADSVLASVTADLAAADSGIEFVYRSLDRLRDRADADDVLIVLDDPSLGRQAFRAGRAPIETSWARELVRSGAPGVHSRPDPIDGAVASSVLQLCSLALRLDVARHDSLHDGLTGLLNRRAFDEHLAGACAQAQRYGWTFTLALLDLDGFKTVNDRLGHTVGDATLRAVGTELRHHLRIGDAAARVGGDEFALVLPNVDAGVVPDLVERIQHKVAASVPDAEVTMTCGAATAPQDGLDCDALYKIADQRLYAGKRR